MRILREPPGAVFDPSTRALCAGSYQGGIPPVDAAPLDKSPLFRVAHEKRWVYAAIAAEDLFVAAAIVRLGYAANAFAFAFDRAKGEMAARFSAVAPAFAATVGDTGQEGCSGRFAWLGAHLSFERGHRERDYRLEIRTSDLRVSARLSSEGMPPPIGAIAKIAGPPEDLFNATEKLVLLPVVGEVIARGKHASLDGALGGLDFTAGYLARSTKWRWAFALGRARSAERVAINLVQGFVGEAECAVWINGEIIPVSQGVIDYDEASPLSPWRVRTEGGELDLTFEPGALHAEAHDFKLIASKFRQPAGSFSGTIRLPKRVPIELDRVLGVTEDQEVLW